MNEKRKTKRHWEKCTQCGLTADRFYLGEMNEMRYLKVKCNHCGLQKFFEEKKKDLLTVKSKEDALMIQESLKKNGWKSSCHRMFGQTYWILIDRKEVPEEKIASLKLINWEVKCG